MRAATRQPGTLELFAVLKADGTLKYRGARPCVHLRLNIAERAASDPGDAVVALKTTNSEPLFIRRELVG